MAVDNLLAPDRITQKLGKFPIWAWGLIGGTVILGGYYLLGARKKARVMDAGVNPAPGDQSLASVFLGMANPEDTANAALPVAGYTGGALSNSQNALGNETLETNLTWLNRGIKISGSGFLVSTTALQKYLSGKALTEAEQVIVSKVLAQIGYPPEGAPLLVKAIKDAAPTPAKKDTPAVTKDTPVVTPKVTTPKVTTPPAAKTGANGYPLDAKNREIIEYGTLDPVYARKVLSGSLKGKSIPVTLIQKDKIYVGVAKKYYEIPATVTN